LHNQLAPFSNCESDVDAGCRSDALSHPFLFGLKRSLTFPGINHASISAAEIPDMYAKV
jgi:hypothetical protein